MTELIFLKRERNEIPFGFKLQGGSDFSIPLSVLQVTENSIADYCGLRPGDAILRINDQETGWMEHSRAKQEIVRAGNDIALLIQRNAVDTTKVQHTPLAQLKSLPAQDLNSYSVPLKRAADLTVQKDEPFRIGSSHNRAPMPFHKDVGSTMVYESAKATNWQPGDYTKFTNPAPTAKNPTVTAVFHNPYNTPIGLYSDNNVFDAFSHQTKGIINPEVANNAAVQNQSQFQQARNVNSSKSMRMLNSAIHETEGTNIQPPSVFDLKRGHNPTGATVPAGFRSVQAPTLPPPDQRHAPMRKEYGVQHVKSSWIEPKIN